MSNMEIKISHQLLSEGKTQGTLSFSARSDLTASVLSGRVTIIDRLSEVKPEGERNILGNGYPLLRHTFLSGSHSSSSVDGHSCTRPSLSMTLSVDSLEQVGRQFCGVLELVERNIS